MLLQPATIDATQSVLDAGNTLGLPCGMGFRLVITGQPVAKGRIRFARKTGHAYTPEKTVAYEPRRR